MTVGPLLPAGKFQTEPETTDWLFIEEPLERKAKDDAKFKLDSASINIKMKMAC